MDILELPNSTIVNRVVPKNAFDSYTNTNQKKQFVEVVKKIRWTHKLSPNTINLSGNEINEIQIFEITLRQKERITDLLQIIDRAISYHIIFIMQFEDNIMLSASKKHAHPTNEN